MKTIKSGMVAIALLLSITTYHSFACTRVVYKGTNGTILTARSMDWKEDIKTDLWIFPRGIERNGEVGPNSIKWKSKYGSITAAAYNIATTDGMNEKGLVANILWLAESKYPVWDKQKPGLAISLWLQYVLDNFATVNEAVDELNKEPFTLITAEMPGLGNLATLHLSLSDKTGDNAIIEYIDGKQVIHHNQSYIVMTNSPSYDKQLALNDYWKGIGGETMLPGTNRAADRFARASFYINAIPKTDNLQIAIASTFSVIRSCSVPFGISTPSAPNISSTRWRTVSDHKNLVYYFESVLTPNVFWVKLNDTDLSEGAPVKKLSLTSNEIYAGNAAKNFTPTPPFKFMGLPTK